MNNTSGKELTSEVVGFIGATLLEMQRFEFFVHGLVAHFKTLQNHKRFKGLNAEIFLSDSEINKKKRKQTLGQIFGVLKIDLSLFYTNELDDYLNNRNILIHDFWRDFVRTDRYEEKRVLSFLNNLNNSTEEWIKVFRGLMSMMAKNAYENSSEEMKKEKKAKFLNILSENEKYEVDLKIKFKNTAKQ